VYEEINNSISERARKYLWQFGTSKGKMEKTDGPLIFNRGEGCYIFDVDGNKYLDGLSGAWVINAGHRQAEIISAMVQQMNRLNYALSEEGYANNIAVALAEKLCLLCYGNSLLSILKTDGNVRILPISHTKKKTCLLELETKRKKMKLQIISLTIRSFLMRILANSYQFAHPKVALISARFVHTFTALENILI
jgi:hypothetical protein